MLDTVQQLSDDVAQSAAAPLWQLPDADVTACLQAARRIEQAAVVWQARLIHHACHTRGIPTAQGHKDAAAWLRTVLPLDSRPSHQLVEFAATLHADPQLRRAILDGRLDQRQAAVITKTVAVIPGDLAAINPAGSANPPAGDVDQFDDVDQLNGVDEFDDPGQLDGAGQPGGDGRLGPEEITTIAEQAEDTMIDMAEHLSASKLSRIGNRILFHVAPEVAERAEEQLLARQEARAHARRGLSISAPVDGLVHLTAIIGVEDAAVLNAALHPLCRPTPDDGRTQAQRRVDALVEVCQLALRTGELPEHGGQPAQLAVTIGYDPLTKALGTATTDTGEHLSAEAARRLACDGLIIPHVLGGAGQVLDVGRAHRLATTALRRALTIRDRGCAWPDCDRPARWTESHHVTPWNDGGHTDLNNLVLLCRAHHRMIHNPDSGWQLQISADGIPEFIPPAFLDFSRRPRRNLYHHRE